MSYTAAGQVDGDLHKVDDEEGGVIVDDEEEDGDGDDDDDDNDEEDDDVEMVQVASNSSFTPFAPVKPDISQKQLNN